MTKFKKIVAGVIFFASILVIGEIIYMLCLGGDKMESEMVEATISLNLPNTFSLVCLVVVGFFSAGLCAIVTSRYLLGYEEN